MDLVGMKGESRSRPVRNPDGTWQASIFVIEKQNLLYAYRTEILRLTAEDAAIDGHNELANLYP